MVQKKSPVINRTFPYFAISLAVRTGLTYSIFANFYQCLTMQLFLIFNWLRFFGNF